MTHIITNRNGLASNTNGLATNRNGLAPHAIVNIDFIEIVKSAFVLTVSLMFYF